MSNMDQSEHEEASLGVCSYPESGRMLDATARRLWANSGHRLPLFNHIVGAREQRWRDGKTERFGGF
jgi:hypothetical protein